MDAAKKKRRDILPPPFSTNRLKPSLLGREVKRAGLLFDGCVEPFSLPRVRRLAIGQEHLLERSEFSVEPRVFYRGSQVGDESRVRASPGDGAFRGIVDAVNIDVRQLSNQTVGPAFLGQPHLFA